MRSSLQQVAERAGVSTMTASNVMRGRHGKMSEPTRKRVLDAMRELDYRPVAPMAPQNRQVETRVIGLIFDAISMDDQWGEATFRGLRETAHELDYDLLTHTRPRTNWSLAQEELRFMDRRSDGLIFIVPKNRSAVLATLAEQNIPVVTCFTNEDVPGVASVTLDSSGVIDRATRHVIAKGHCRIGYLGGPHIRSDYRLAHAAYINAMKAAGLAGSAVHIEASDTNLDSPVQTMLDKIAEHQLTAVVCASDPYALELWQSAEQRGWEIPRDLSIISAGNIPQSEALGLTTASYSSEDIGREAMRSVVRMIGGANAASCDCVIPLEFVERTSVRQLN